MQGKRVKDYWDAQHHQSSASTATGAHKKLKTNSLGDVSPLLYLVNFQQIHQKEAQPLIFLLQSVLQIPHCFSLMERFP